MNYDALAIGLLEIFTEEEKTIMAFGMIPHDKFQWFMEQLFEGIAEKATAPGGTYEGWTAKYVLDNMEEQYKVKVEKEMGKALYRNAKMVV